MGTTHPTNGASMLKGSSTSSGVNSKKMGTAVVGAITCAWLSSNPLYQKLWIARQKPDSDIAVHFRQSTDRYKDILDYKGELWSDEGERPPSSEKPVFFDWMTTRPNVEPPKYAHPKNPLKANIFPTYTKPGDNPEVVDVVLAIGIPQYVAPRDSTGYPLSPTVTVGETSTGVHGRGVLGQWGPNLAGDALITRRHPQTGKLQIILIKRTDGSEKYAFPGGFVDYGEAHAPERTIVREFLEEAMDVQNNTSPEAEKNFDILREVFGEFSIEQGKVSFPSTGSLKPGKMVYAGYVNDERNTDNAWIETVAMNWHFEKPEASEIELTAGDDAAKDSAAFYDVVDDPRLKEKGTIPLENLFASHSDFLRMLLEKYYPDDLPKEMRTASKERVSDCHK